MKDRSDHWRISAGLDDLLIARRVAAAVPPERRLTPDEARRAVRRAVREPWSDVTQAAGLLAMARAVVRDVGLAPGASPRAVVEAALLRRVLVAWRAAPLEVRARAVRPEGESTEPGPYIPLASELIREHYEQGIEVDDELIEDDPASVEVWDVASDEPCDAVEVEDEASDDPADALELDDEASDDPAEAAAPAAEGEPVPQEPAADEADAEIEAEDEVEDDECEAIEEESEGDDPAEPDWGDAVDPEEDAPAAAEGGETGSR